jgi:hypothetical protein
LDLNSMPAVRVSGFVIYNLVLEVTSRRLSLPPRELLALELNQTLHEAISDLPDQVSPLKKVEIIDIQS